MHSLSYRYININKPGVWVICGMRFYWNVRSSKLGDIKVTAPDNVLNTTSIYCTYTMQ